MITWIKGGQVIDPRLGTKNKLDIVVRKGKIEKILPPGNFNPASDIDVKVIDASGMIVTPGLIDMHVHFREPGEEYKETVATGSQAAAAGGFTAVSCMPNTTPINDSRSVTEFILERARKANLIRVYPVAAISRGLKSESLTEFGDLKEAGAVAVSDDGRPVTSSELMRRAIEYARFFHLPVISHCEDLDLSNKGVMHEGTVSTRLGLKGIPAASEEIMVVREILLARLTGYPVHISHISTEGSVKFIKQAKEEGIAVTAETAPHYFSLDHTAVIDFDSNAKMYPPLREPKDVEAIKRGLSEGVIDVIATDHAPHSPLEKDVEFDKAAFGIIGLETALPLTLALVREGVMDLPSAIAKLSYNSASILHVRGGMIEEGKEADLTIIDLNNEYVIEGDGFRSKSHNSPFIGFKMKGKAILTMVGGRIVWESDELNPGS
ncbi:MAG: dihydroorotase [Deltaproteobacteria bacterium]|nr:MAG: dihydroorotase [Deltaproteobacteria bacterium]